MRRREKFVLASVVLSIGLLLVQYVQLDWRYWAVALFTVITYFISAWALSEDLQKNEWLTIVPSPALFAGSVALFYFLLPANIISRITLLVVFGIGMYAQLLTANIFSVAKGRTIQLLHAALAVGLLFSLITSLLVTNTIYSLHLPFYVTGLMIAAAHFPLIFTNLWSVTLSNPIQKEVWIYSGVLTLILSEIALLLCFMPLTAWYGALFIMSLLYVGVSLLRSHLMGRLFVQTATEYTLVTIFIIVMFLFIFPGK